MVSAISESVPDGTNYVAQSALYAVNKNVQIRTTSSGYQKL